MGQILVKPKQEQRHKFACKIISFVVYKHLNYTHFVSISAVVAQTLLNNSMDLKTVSASPIKYVSAETTPQHARYYALDNLLTFEGYNIVN